MSRTAAEPHVEMSTYEYRGLKGEQGVACGGRIEADNVKEARRRLAAQGILAERVRRVRGTARLDRPGRIWLYGELGSLLQAGLTADEALEMMLKGLSDRRRAAVLSGIREGVHAGRSLASSVSEADPKAPQAERAILGAAERAGALEGTLQNLAAAMEREDALRERIRGALVYPCVVFAAGLCVSAVMLGVLLPRVEALMGVRGELPAVTRWMLWLGRNARLALPLAAGAALAAAVLHVNRLRRYARWVEGWERFAFRVPLLRTAMGLVAGLRFSRTLGIVLQGGMAAVDGIRLAGQATGLHWLRRLCDEAAENIRHGVSLSDALRDVPPLSNGDLPGWIALGEARGDVSSALEQAAQRYERGWTRFVQRFAGLLEPAMVLGLGGFVLLVTLAVLMPILALTRLVH